ncbi:MAG: hypothetical protein Q9P44_18725 [Anaerolineae bacterium]|nr:hypothetical protein [Anaerolineae bacterium]
MFDKLMITDQAAHPAILPDGRIVLAWVDRFQSQSIRARLAANVESPFDPASEVLVYAHQASEKTQKDDTGALLEEMRLWSFGLPYAETLANGEVLVFYYAGNNQTMDIHYARLRV